MTILKNILFFAFPPCCEVCGRLLAESENLICSYCLLELPRTNFHTDENNSVAMLFWGRVKIEYASSWFYFYKGSPFQPLLHKLKYKGQKEIGIVLGRYFATEILKSPFCSADLILPVPLHPRKIRRRGYNQSEMIAIGISEVFQKELITHALIRTSHTDTQTKKNRFERFLNMDGKFIVAEPDIIQSKSCLLIDDVITTGSTIEACATALLEAGCREVLVLTLAVA